MQQGITLKYKKVGEKNCKVPNYLQVRSVINCTKIVQVLTKSDLLILGVKMTTFKYKKGSTVSFNVCLRKISPSFGYSSTQIEGC